MIDRIAEEEEKYRVRDELTLEIRKMNKSAEGFADEERAFTEREKNLNDEILKLKETIKALKDAPEKLSGTSKLVGIISHREELMENIPQQIRVKKTKDGSRLTVETGL